MNKCPQFTQKAVFFYSCCVELGRNPRERDDELGFKNPLDAWETAGHVKAICAR